ncbi:hypothetical protein F5884DRAFT_316300 [Xylogone sp. PMI_703]|nr:hypothetical protein F5884DRAFT_316300 [Xylogone sp. PMI_703]
MTMFAFSRKYDLVPSNETGTQNLCREEYAVVHRKQQRHAPRLAIYLIAEAIILLALFIIYDHWRFVWLKHNEYVDRFIELGTYNVTKIFTENIDPVEKSPTADSFWNKIQETDGIVSVPSDWGTQYISSGFIPFFTLSAPHTESTRIKAISRRVAS